MDMLSFATMDTLSVQYLFFEGSVDEFASASSRWFNISNQLTGDSDFVSTSTPNMEVGRVFPVTRVCKTQEVKKMILFIADITTPHQSYI